MQKSHGRARAVARTHSSAPGQPASLHSRAMQHTHQLHPQQPALNFEPVIALVISSTHNRSPVSTLTFDQSWVRFPKSGLGLTNGP
ncbi:hypothetical protein Mapa_014685 [Marchantia paleacea]|nr:hypothetical protein Mapa_014685 [Marchantia paleacea]